MIYEFPKNKISLNLNLVKTIKLREISNNQSLFVLMHKFLTHIDIWSYLEHL